MSDQAKKIKVRCLESCAGLWGALYTGDERELDIDLAESLLRAGHVEAVHPEGGGHPQMEKKDETPAKRRSKRAKES